MKRIYLPVCRWKRCARQKKTYVLPNQLTGANYFQAMPISEKTPQRAVEQFIYAIEKGDLTRALAFATTESSQDTSRNC